MTLTKLKPNSLILIKKNLTKECATFNSKLSSGMSSILTRMHRCFIWQLHYCISILFPILSHRFMKRGTYIVSHKTNLLSMAFIELVSSFYYKVINISIFSRFSQNDDLFFCSLVDQRNTEDTLFLEKHRKEFSAP